MRVCFPDLRLSVICWIIMGSRYEIMAIVCRCFFLFSISDWSTEWFSSPYLTSNYFLTLPETALKTECYCFNLNVTQLHFHFLNCSMTSWAKYWTRTSQPTVEDLSKIRGYAVNHKRRASICRAQQILSNPCLDFWYVELGPIAWSFFSVWIYTPVRWSAQLKIV